MAINLKNIQVNIPRANIEDYFFTVYGKPKAGKTSLFAKLVEEIYGDMSKGLLIGFERGFNALKVVAQAVDEWTDYLDIVDQLIENKAELGFKVIGIDTADMMYKMATAYVLKRESRKDSKKYIAINDIPWGKGHEYIEQEISNSLNKLKNAGYGLIVITHETDKKFESRDGVSYDKTTTSLPTRIRDAVLNMSDFICFIDIAKEKGLDGKLVDKRYIYFRADGADLEAGSRFENVPNKIEYDIKEFVRTFENAVLSAFGNDSKMVEKAKKEQKTEREKKADEYIEKAKLPTNDELVLKIKEKYGSASQEQVAQINDILEKAQVTSLGDPDKVPFEVLTKILEVLGE